MTPEKTVEESVINHESIELSDHQRWQGTYKGISYQIAKWKPPYYKNNPEYDTGYKWNYYIFVKPRKLVTYELASLGKTANYNKMYHDVEMPGGYYILDKGKNIPLK
jgi:hypothetical protein